MKHSLALGLVWHLLSGCQPGNSLGGSVGDVFPLDISAVEVARNNEAIQVTYLRNRSVSLDVVIRLSVSLDGIDSLQSGIKIPLEGAAPSGVARSSVSTAPGGEPVRNLPPIHKGELVLSRLGDVDELTQGHFTMSFEKEGGDVGFGRTLFGDFSAQTRDAGFGD